MFDPQDDPLGLGLKQRARERRMGMFSQNPALAGLQSPLGEDWDAFFQATDEAAGGRPVKFAGGATPEAINPLPNDATLQDLENARTMRSNQLQGIRPSVAGLRKMR